MRTIVGVVQVVFLVLSGGCLAGPDDPEAPDEGTPDAAPANDENVAHVSVYTEMSFRCRDQGCALQTVVRVQPNGALYWATIDGMTELDTTDANFRKVPGRANANCASYESIKYPNNFLRHGGAQLVLSSNFFDFNFNKEATFCENGPRIESYDAPGWFLRKTGSSLYLSTIPSVYDPAWTETLIAEEGRATIGMYDPDLGITSTNGSIDWVWESWGWCTGITQPGAPPSYSCTQPGIVLTNVPWWLNPTQFRPLIACSASTPWFGTYPRIRATKRWGEPFHKIETSIGFCF